jgi:hypothetical protein
VGFPYGDVSVLYNVVSEVRNEAIQGTDCCASKAMLSVFIALLTVPYVLQERQLKAFLLFHPNYRYSLVPKYFIVLTLSILLGIIFLFM